MKKCSRCQIEKPLEDFNFKNKKLKTLQKSCKYCTREEIRRHYYKNREYYIIKARKRNAEIRSMLRQYILKFLQKHPCVDCGEKDPIVLEFDHQKDKLTSVSKILQSRRRTLDILKKEIAKCVVRCANCHRRKTAKDFNWYKLHAPVAQLDRVSVFGTEG